jgi:hypothetical protein
MLIQTKAKVQEVVIRRTRKGDEKEDRRSKELRKKRRVPVSFKEKKK